MGFDRFGEKHVRSHANRAAFTEQIIIIILVSGGPRGVFDSAVYLALGAPLQVQPTDVVGWTRARRRQTNFVERNTSVAGARLNLIITIIIIPGERAGSRRSLFRRRGDVTRYARARAHRVSGVSAVDGRVRFAAPFSDVSARDRAVHAGAI